MCTTPGSSWWRGRRTSPGRSGASWPSAWMASAATTRTGSEPPSPDAARSRGWRDEPLPSLLPSGPAEPRHPLSNGPRLRVPVSLAVFPRFPAQHRMLSLLVLLVAAPLTGQGVGRIGFSRYTLTNGLEVTLAPDRSTQVVAV